MKNIFYILFCISITAFCQATNYVIHEIPELGCAEQSQPFSINNRGEIIGELYYSNRTDYFFWSPKSGLTLINGFPSSVTDIRVEKMNNIGQVVGTCMISSGWFFKSYVAHGFLWSQQTGYVDLGAIDGKDTYALDCNDSGKVVLVSEGSCYLWDNGIITKVDGIKGVRSPIGYYPDIVINNKDQLAFYQDIPNGKVVKHDAKIYNMVTYESRSLMDGHKGAPSVGAINDYGTVAGSVQQYRRTDGFLAWPTGAFQVILNFIPYSLNNDAIAVGASYDLEGRVKATIFKEGVLSYLEDLSFPLDPTIITKDYLSYAIDINDKDEIVAIMSDGDKIRTVMLEPFDPAAAKAN